MDNQFRPRKQNIALLCLTGYLVWIGLFGESKHTVNLDLLGLQSVLVIPRANAQLPPQTAVLRYDGLYYSFDQKGNFTRYFRFYEDGTVLSINLTGNAVGEKPTLSLVTAALSTASLKDNHAVNQGTYTIEDDRDVPRLQFITASTAKKPAKVSYTGTLSLGSISLSSLSLSTGFAEQRDYLFVPVQFTDLPKATAAGAVGADEQAASPDALVGGASAPPEQVIEIVSQDAGLHYPGSTATDSFNRITLLQGRYTTEKTFRERGVEFVDRCSTDQEAVGQSGITDYSSDEFPIQPIPPTSTGRADAKVWFLSRKTPPANGLRVVIRNQSQANQVGDIPFSDRNYSQGLASENFEVALEQGHKNRFLSVNTGVNQFIYEIKRGSQIVETGEFTAAFQLGYKDLTRVVTIERPKLDMACIQKPKRR